MILDEGLRGKQIMFKYKEFSVNLICQKKAYQSDLSHAKERNNPASFKGLK